MSEFVDEKTELDDIDPKKITGSVDEIEVITRVFNSRILNIINFCKQSNPDSPEFTTLDNLVRASELADPTTLIVKCKDKMWTSREYIQTRNERYFLDRDYNDLIKKDANQELIQSLVNLIKSGWKTLDVEEKDVIWQKTRTMLKAVIYFTKWERASSKQ